MKTYTIHSSALGDVLNPSSATGFRVVDERTGRSVELRVVDGKPMLVVDDVIVDRWCAQ